MATTAQAASAEKTAPCLARQPILAKDEKVLGYEVSFPGITDAHSSPSTPDQAACDILDAVKEAGLEVLCDGRLAFLQCTPSMLLQEALLTLPPDKVIIDLRPEVTADASVLEACQGLKRKGYKIAISDFCEADSRKRLLPLADFLRVDSRRRAESYAQIAAIHGGKPYKLLAQNVNSRTEFRDAAKAGFGLFQGYFFRHPERMRVRQIPAGQTSKLRLLQAISAPEIDFAQVEELIRHDASLCYRLLRYLNSPLLGFALPIQSVHHAIRLLGDRALTRWIHAATVMSLGQPKCSDLVLASLVRARFGELMAPELEHGSADLFLVGMLSLMDSVLETPMEIVLEGLALDPHAKAALLAIQNGGGARLSPICDLMAAREKGDWERVEAYAAKLNLPLTFLNRAYMEAMEWAHQMTRAAS
jgi:EAL and modified HD-GYP domain-containing signal transduction protein